MKLGAWLVAMMQPLLAKILVSLGFSVVSITGLTAITNSLKTQAATGLSLLDPGIAALFGLAGGPEGLGIIIGACTTKLMLWTLQSSTKIIASGPG